MFRKIRSTFRKFSDVLKDNKDEINRKNYEIGRKIYFFCIIILLMYCLVSFLFPSFKPLKLFYVCSATVAIVEYIIHITLFKKHQNLVSLSNCVLLSSILLFGLLLGTFFSNDTQTTMFMIILVSVPVCFIERYYRLVSITTFFSIAFVIVASFTESIGVLTSDIANLIASWSISQFLILNILNLRLNELILTKQYLSDSKYDELTHLPNRRSLNNEMLKINTVSNLNQTQFAVAMLDIDNFKLYNDEYGHIVGDVCLEQIATLLKYQCEQQNVFISRYGGEEFVAIMVDKTEQEVYDICEQLRKSIEEAKIEHVKNPGGVVTVSIGYAIKSSSSETAFDLLDKADEALYDAKRSGRNKVNKR